MGDKRNLSVVSQNHLLLNVCHTEVTEEVPLDLGLVECCAGMTPLVLFRPLWARCGHGSLLIQTSACSLVWYRPTARRGLGPGCRRACSLVPRSCVTGQYKGLLLLPMCAMYSLSGCVEAGVIHRYKAGRLAPLNTHPTHLSQHTSTETSCRTPAGIGLLAPQNTAPTPAP